MRDARDFNPYIVHLNTGRLHEQQIVSERMCVWYEIELITQSDGGGVLTLDQLLPAERGTIYIRRPGMIVHGLPPYAYCGILFDAVYDPALVAYYDKKENVMNAHFDRGLLEHVYARGAFFDFLEALPPTIAVQSFDLFAHLFNSMVHVFLRRPANFQLYAKNLLMQIIVALMDEQSLGALGDRSSLQIVRETQRYIDSHYMDRMRLADLAKKCALSREYFCRLFRRVTGCAPMEYIQSVRLFHAKQMLIMTNDTVERIAEHCGFSSVQHFYEVFRRAVHTSPGAYRMEACGTGFGIPARRADRPGPG